MSQKEVSLGAFSECSAAEKEGEDIEFGSQSDNATDRVLKPRDPDLLARTRSESQILWAYQ